MGYRKDDHDHHHHPRGLQEEDPAQQGSTGGGEETAAADGAEAAPATTSPMMTTNEDIWATAQGYTPLTDLAAAASGATTTTLSMGDGATASPMVHEMGTGGSSFQGVWVSSGPAADDEDDDATGGPTGGGGGGAFFADLSAFNAVAYQDDDDDDEESDEVNETVNDDSAAAGEATTATTTTTTACASINNNNNTSSSVQESDVDYRAVADRALSVLEADYLQTVQGCTEVERKSRFEEARGLAAGVVPAFEESTTATKDVAPTTTTSIITDDMNFASDWDAAFSNLDNSSDSKPAARSGLSTPWKQPKKDDDDTAKKELPDIDADAVRRAVAAIQLQQPRIEQEFSTWELRHKEQQGLSILPPATHALIPAEPLAAFRKRPKRQQQSATTTTATSNPQQHSTKASRAATARFSRAASLAESLHRLDILRGQENGICLHLLGCDGTVECGSVQQVQDHFAPLVQWIGMARQAPKSIQMHCIGPNIPPDMVTTGTDGINLMPTTTSTTSSSSPTNFRNLESATVYCHLVTYDEWLDQQKRDNDKESTSNSRCDLVMAFNAGVWGYKEWEPTIESMIRRAKQVPTIFTAYTLAEAEEDYEVIEKLLKGEGKTKEAIEAATIWEPEVNPYASQEQRPTATAIPGQLYRENGAWQAWRF